MNCFKLSKLEFQGGSNLARIGKFAFARCLRLQSICIPALVERIGDSAFSQSGIKQISVDAGNSHFRVTGEFLLDSNGNCYFSSEANPEIPSGVTAIAVGAFSKSVNLESVCIPASVESLYRRCFDDCKLLSVVRFAPGSKLTRIESVAFRKCKSLKTFCIPGSVEQIDVSAFFGTQISNMTVDDTNTNFRIFGDFLVDFSQKVLIWYFGAEPELTIDRRFEQIGSSCFWRHSTLSKVEFESGSALTCIGDEAFYSVSSLISICIPASVERVCSRCFSECGSLSEIVFGPGSKLRTIGEFAFNPCNSLTGIIIPASVTEIAGSAFALWKSRALLPQIEGTFHFCENFLVDSSKLVRFFRKARHVTVDREVERIGNYCFGCNQRLGTFHCEPGSRLRVIEDEAFLFCSTLKSVEVPASVEIIGKRCFSGCHEFHTLTFERNSQLSHIHEQAFACCYSLRSMIIPASVLTIGAKIFTLCGCAKLKFEAGSQLREIGEKAFYRCNIRSISLPPLVTTISKSCFGDCRHLSVLSFGPNLTRIEESVISGCRSLSSIVIPASVEFVDRNWALGSALSTVTFESGAVLHRMRPIRYCYIDIPSSEDATGFLGYSVVSSGNNGSVRRLVWTGDDLEVEEEEDLNDEQDEEEDMDEDEGEEEENWRERHDDDE
jgi:hypothetical protein